MQIPDIRLQGVRKDTGALRPHVGFLPLLREAHGAGDGIIPDLGR